MRYVIVDQDGASRGHFEAFSDLLHVIDEIRNEDVALVGDFFVIKYDDSGSRVGAPIEASHLVPLAAQEVAAVTVTEARDAPEAGSAGHWHAESLQTA